MRFMLNFLQLPGKMEERTSVSISVIKLKIALLITCSFHNQKVVNYLGSNQMAGISNTGTPVSTQGEGLGPHAHQALTTSNPGFAKMFAWTQRFARTMRDASSRILIYTALCLFQQKVKATLLLQT